MESFLNFQILQIQGESVMTNPSCLVNSTESQQSSETFLSFQLNLARAYHSGCLQIISRNTIEVSSLGSIEVAVCSFKKEKNMEMVFDSLLIYDS